MAATTARRAADVASQEGSTPCPERGGAAVAGANQSFAGRARGPRRAGEGAVGSGGRPLVRRGGGGGGGAKGVLPGADGHSYSEAAVRAGRRVGDTVAGWVARFNREGLSALAPGHGGGPAPQYGEAERARILAEFRREPDRERDGTAAWSLRTLQRALRSAADGLPGVSVDTIARVLHDSGLSWQASRSWCDTGTSLRTRKAGVFAVTDPDTAEKKP